ncbi:MAG: nickel pincer cofactor biosynthesis protein LarB [Planctomycetota bacterium]|nr:MAG: nickel pincer cofactor biosynthesis protein LarB [Planctomycetota bacterium]
MDRARLRQLLEQVERGELDVAAALERLSALPFHASASATLDTHRELRTGFPEAVYAAGKTPQQVAEAAAALACAHDRVLITRAAPDHYAAVRALLPAAAYRQPARCIIWRNGAATAPSGSVCVIAAGTSDLPVADEAAVTAEMLDAAVVRVTDVGVAGLHRLLSRLEALRKADALVVCAGMEGALPSAVGGLVSAPVIAVPTSVGYGASYGGLAALLAMLNSCAPGVAVVNIDNGFGAGLIAARIARAAAR